MGGIRGVVVSGRIGSLLNRMGYKGVMGHIGKYWEMGNGNMGNWRTDRGVIFGALPGA